MESLNIESGSSSNVKEQVVARPRLGRPYLILLFTIFASAVGLSAIVLVIIRAAATGDKPSGKDHELLRPHISLSIIGSDCDNALRKRGVLTSLSKLNCGKFAANSSTRIFGTLITDVDIFKKWLDPPESTGSSDCTLEAFRNEMEMIQIPTVAMEAMSKLNEKITEFDAGVGARIFYLCLPPRLAADYAIAIHERARAQSEDVRIMLEKPIGTDMASAIGLQKQLRDKQIGDDELYLIDHVLGKPMVHMLFDHDRLGSKADPHFHDIFSNHYWKRVVITQKETRDLRGRVYSFFNDVGQVRDMTQSHLLQILAISALAPDTSSRISMSKTFLLSSISVTNNIAGQYNGYLEQLMEEASKAKQSVDISNLTIAASTYHKMTLRIDDERWRDVDFVIETGKNLQADTLQVRYEAGAEADSDCNLVVNVGGLLGVHSVTNDPHWIALENAESCTDSVVERFHEIARRHSGESIAESEDTGRLLYKITPPQANMPDYANVFEAVIEKNHDFFINLNEVVMQWSIVGGYLDLPPDSVQCYEKCEVADVTDDVVACPQLGHCQVLGSEATNVADVARILSAEKDLAMKQKTF